MTAEARLLSRQARIHLVKVRVLPVLRGFLCATHFLHQRVEAAALAYVRNPNAYKPLLDSLNDLVLYARHFTENEHAVRTSVELLLWCQKLTRVVTCVCGHSLRDHEPVDEHGKCLMDGCACGPGCIHEGFVDNDDTTSSRMVSHEEA